MALSKEKAKRWVREQASRFLESYFKESLGSRHPALTILRRLSAQVLRAVLNEIMNPTGTYCTFQMSVPRSTT